MSLLGRLVPVWHELGPAHAEGLRHAMGRLALVYGSMDTRSPSPLVRWVEGKGGGGDGTWRH